MELGGTVRKRSVRWTLDSGSSACLSRPVLFLGKTLDSKGQDTLGDMLPRVTWCILATNQSLRQNCVEFKPV